MNNGDDSVKKWRCSDGAERRRNIGETLQIAYTGRRLPLVLLQIRFLREQYNNLDSLSLITSSTYVYWTKLLPKSNCIKTCFSSAITTTRVLKSLGGIS